MPNPSESKKTISGLDKKMEAIVDKASKTITEEFRALKKDLRKILSR